MLDALCKKRPHLAPFAIWAERFYKEHRSLLLLVWDVFGFSVVGLSGFLRLLYHNRANHDFQYVICTGAALYFFVLLGQTVLLLRRDDRHEKLVAAKRVLRLIYTAIYLTSIMLEVIPMSQTPGNEPLIAYKGFLFFWAALWGTNFLWVKRVSRRLNAAVLRSDAQSDKIINITAGNAVR